MDNKKMVYGIGALLVIVVVGSFFLTNPEEAHLYDDFAQCVSETDTTFYGAWWCPACNDQKSKFKKSVKLLPYVECSSPDRQTVYQECIDADIQSYPTWVFPDGSRQSGSLALETIAEKTSCELPVAE